MRRPAAGVRERLRVAVVAGAVLSSAAVAHGQPDSPGITSGAAPQTADVAAPQRLPRLEVSVLGGVLTGADLGDGRASMLTNQLPTSGQAALFTTSTRIDAAATAEARVGVRLSRAWAVEGGVSYARPVFSVEISDDVEAPSGVTASSRLTQVIVDAALQRRWTGRRVTPFVMAGGGYLRQLDQLRATADTGTVVYAGGGVRIALAPNHRGFAGRLALRGDARVVWLRDGITLNDERGPAVSASAGLSIGL